MSQTKEIAEFDPNDVGVATKSIFGLPFTEDSAQLVIIPVPWEVTVSYRTGTARGPASVLEASFQVDLYDPLVRDAWKLGMAMVAVNEELYQQSCRLRGKAEMYLEQYCLGTCIEKDPELQSAVNEINQACSEMIDWVEKEARTYLDRGKLVGLLGGDHSTPLGLIQALGKKQPDFGILQIDAHADLRVAYEGFTYSHASIMYNALQVTGVTSLTQVGIRDYCQAEKDLIDNDPRIQTFFDHEIKARQFSGETWQQICKDIVKVLPDKVYLSVDIDGLDPKLCPNTGTPVPGGFEFEQVIYLIHEIIKSGKQIIGFDINEVSPGMNSKLGEWDAIVGARLLYRVSNLVLSQSLK